MPTSVSVATAIAWLLVLLWSFTAAGPHGAVAFDSPSALIGDAIELIIISVIAGSLYFAHTPRRWLAVLLLLVSIIPALVFAYSLWTNIFLFRTFGLHYIDAVLLGPAVCGVVFVILALLWARICWRFRDIAASSRRDYSRHVGIGLITLAALLVLLLSIRPFGNQVEYGRHTRVQADIQGIGTQLKLYESINGFYPTTEQGLRALVVQPDTDPRPTRWHQLCKDVPKDPWQNDYIYMCPGQRHPESYDLYSAGPSRKPGAGTDDWGE
jgi:general secretion pathway protein G